MMGSSGRCAHIHILFKYAQLQTNVPDVTSARTHHLPRRSSHTHHSNLYFLNSKCGHTLIHLNPNADFLYRPILDANPLTISPLTFGSYFLIRITICAVKPLVLSLSSLSSTSFFLENAHIVVEFARTRLNVSTQLLILENTMTMRIMESQKTS